MAILTILEFPDPRLRTQAKPVEAVDSRIRQLALASCIVEAHELQGDAAVFHRASMRGW